MKFLVVALFLIWSSNLKSQPIFSENGHPEHLIAGTIISAGISYFVFTKTGNKLKSWLIGAISTTVLSYLKEAVDPKWFGGVKSSKDFMFSTIGSCIGASIVIPLKNPNAGATRNFDKLF